MPAQLRNPTTSCPWDLEQTHASLVPTCWKRPTRWLTPSVMVMTTSSKRTRGPSPASGAACADRWRGATASRCHRRWHWRQADRRHPHVFGDAQATNSDEVRRSWDAIKLEERQKPCGLRQSLSDQLRSKVRGLPALAGAMTISKKAAMAASNGTTWPACGRRSMRGWTNSRRRWPAAPAHAQEELGDPDPW